MVKKGYTYPDTICPVVNCRKKMSVHWLKPHLLFYHNYKYTQASPNFPVARAT